MAKYVEKRKLQREGLDEQSYMYVTPRTLLGIIRLSQSLAKLAQRQLVNQSDVDEALKLMDFSIRSLRTLKADSSKAAETKSRQAGRSIQSDDRMTEVIKAVREAIQESRQTSLKVGEIFKALQKKRMIVDRDELQTVLVHYSKLQIIMLDSEDNVIFL